MRGPAFENAGRRPIHLKAITCPGTDASSLRREGLRAQQMRSELDEQTRCWGRRKTREGSTGTIGIFEHTEVGVKLQDASGGVMRR